MAQQQRRDIEQNLWPESLLQAAQREDNRTGRLKVFGFGLAIARSFVEAIRSMISATNCTSRRGAVVTIRLPDPADAEALDIAT